VGRERCVVRGSVAQKHFRPAVKGGLRQGGARWERVLGRIEHGFPKRDVSFPFRGYPLEGDGS